MNRSIKYELILPMALFLIYTSSYAFTTLPISDDEEAIKKVFQNLSNAWEQADGALWGSSFTKDADFTVWFGLHLKGREAISEGHQWVFDSVYPNTRYELEIRDLKYLKPDIAVVHLDGSIIKPGGTLPDEPHTLPVAVLQKMNEEWKIVMFHNMKNQIKEVEEGRARGNMGDVRQ